MLVLEDLKYIWGKILRNRGVSGAAARTGRLMKKERSNYMKII